MLLLQESGQKAGGSLVSPGLAPVLELERKKNAGAP